MLLSALLSSLALVRAHQEVFHPEWADRQAVLGFGSETDSSNTCNGVCLLTPEQMEGPFYLSYALDRANITEGRPGIPVELTLTVHDVSAKKGCTPLANAWVDIWSADSEGVYSGYGKEGEEALHSKRNWSPLLGGAGGTPRPPGPPGRAPPGPPPYHVPPSNDHTFLRGVQQTDADGKVTFHTVYPGWYPGRTTHIHLKVHPPSWDSSTANSTHAHTTQIYFSEDLNERVANLQPYRDNTVRRTTNDRDFLFRQMKGAGTLDASVEGEIEGSGDVYPSGFIKASKAIGIDKWW